MRRATYGLTILVGCLGGCSSSDPATPTAPTTPPVTNVPPTPPTPPPVTATIVIGSNNAFTPTEVAVAVGGRVTFINQNTRAHDITSDPLHLHTDCPAVLDVGFIQPGQTKQTGPLTAARVCGVHDHMQETNPALRARIIVQ
jgi:plastocyanin